jgi:hypothetical protein
MLSSLTRSSPSVSFLNTVSADGFKSPLPKFLALSVRNDIPKSSIYALQPMQGGIGGVQRRVQMQGIELGSVIIYYKSIQVPHTGI